MPDKDKASKIKGLAWAVAAVTLAALFGFGISPIVRLIPWSWEQKTSEWFGLPSSHEVCNGNFKSQALLTKLTNRIYPLDRDDARFSIQVQIVNDSTLNAFARLGGKISINSGLLKNAESPEEVAGVLAHEIEHVRRRHILEGLIVRLMTVEGIKMVFSSGGSLAKDKWSNFFLRMSFSRYQEAEADEGALMRLQKTHIDNRGYRNFFERMKEMGSMPTFLSDHPANQARSEMVEKYQNRDTKPIMTGEEWKRFKEYCS